MKSNISREPEASDSLEPERRRFLGSACAAIVGAPALLGFASSPVLASSLPRGSKQGRVPMVSAAPATPSQGEVSKMERITTRRLHLLNEHTGDDHDLVYYSHGFFLKDNLSKLNHLMRDRRANIATQMDTTLYDQLFMLARTLDTEEPVHILSGYRTPETNAKLRKRSRRVAKYSLHMEGRAADIYIPGFSVKQLQEAALSLQAGGVGLYSNANFIHIDTGLVRHWGS